MKKKIIIGAVAVVVLIVGICLFFLLSGNDKTEQIKEDFVAQLGIEEPAEKTESDSGIKIDYQSQDIYTVYNLLYSQIEVEVKSVDDDQVVMELKTVDLENIDQDMDEKEMIAYLKKEDIEKKSHEVTFDYEYKDDHYLFDENEDFYRAIYYSYYDDYFNGLTEE